MSQNLELSPINSFLYAYFFTLETRLNNQSNGIEQVKFQSEEANTDEHLKAYFQAFIHNHNSLRQSTLKAISIKVDSEIITLNIEHLQSFEILDVLLPNQLTDELKIKISQSKKSVYTNPDLYLIISDGYTLFYESVELKSTKNNTITGSSIQQIFPFEWVIFIKREQNHVTIATGFYINAITEKLPFPDRSPRPQIGFNTLAEWNKKYRKIEDDVLFIENIVDFKEQKIKLLVDWQNYLAEEWLSIIQESTTRNNEKWFNNTIRKFSLKLLEYTEGLSPSEMVELKNRLTKQIHKS